MGVGPGCWVKPIQFNSIQLPVAPVVMLRSCIANGLDCITYVLFVACVSKRPQRHELSNGVGGRSHGRGCDVGQCLKLDN